MTKQELDIEENQLRPVFYNGKLLVDEDLETIRERAENVR